MALKNILVHLDGSPESERRLRASITLARHHDAHLTALFIIDTLFPYYKLDPSLSYLGWNSMEPMIDEMLEKARAEAHAARTQFEALLVSEDFRGDFRAVEGPTAATLVMQARHADLCVLGQEPPGTRPPGGFPLERVLFGSGRPIIVVPRHGEFEQIGSDVVVGWRATKESARAVNDALPLLEKARRTTVLTVRADPDADEESLVDGADIAVHLARHGLTVVTASQQSDPGQEGKTLLDFAADSGADLIVVGGYGHTRLQEFVFGGVTRTVLSEMQVPVLLSH